MPKAFLVKKKRRISRPIPAHSVVSNPTNGYSRDFSAVRTNSPKTFKQEYVRRTCSRIWPPSVVSSADFNPLMCPPVLKRCHTQDGEKNFTNTKQMIDSSESLGSLTENLQPITDNTPTSSKETKKNTTTLSSVNPRKTFTCKHCSKVYISLGALKMHIRTHTLPCECQVCGKAFSRPWLLQGHLRIHTGEKPYICTHCDRAFADRSNLRAHLQTHSEVKKYSCKSCAKTFSRISLLVKHQGTGCPGLR